MKYHSDLLSSDTPDQEIDDAIMAPILSSSVLKHGRDTTSQDTKPMIPQIGLLAGITNMLESLKLELEPNDQSLHEDPRLLFNVSSPSSTFICGSQGSGKSHTLSCMLENCLIPSKAGRLPNPLTGLVFHYDSFISDTVGSPCEAAFLSSHSGVDVRVLCAPTNIHTIRVRTFLFSLLLYLIPNFWRQGNLLALQHSGRLAANRPEESEYKAYAGSYGSGTGRWVNATIHAHCKTYIERHASTTANDRHGF